MQSESTEQSPPWQTIINGMKELHDTMKRDLDDIKGRLHESLKSDVEHIKLQLNEFVQRSPSQQTSARPLSPVRGISKRQSTNVEADIAPVSQESTSNAAAAAREVADLRSQVTRLRGMITAQANNVGEVVDSDLTTAYGVLRSKIQGLVHQHCSSKPRPPRTPAINSRHMQEKEPWVQSYKRDFWAAVDKQQPEETYLQYELRAALFDIIHHNIFNTENFRLAASIEEQLKAFERQLGKTIRAEHLSEYMEWRCRTVRCAQWLQQTSPTIQETVQDVLTFLRPVWEVAPARREPPAPLKTATVDVCTRAYELSILARQSTSEYVFEIVERETFYVGEESDFEPQAIDGGHREPVGLKVALTLFGSLVKYPDFSRNRQRRYVLDKAHVVLH